MSLRVQQPLPSSPILDVIEGPRPARPAPATQPGNVSDVLVGLLATLGVEEAYGVSGGAIAPFCVALGRSRLRVLHFRHEAGAGYAAVESHFASGRPALVFATSGPGLTNVLTGALAARWEGAKLVLVSGATSGPQRGRWPAQETSAYTLPYTGLFTAGPLFHFAAVLEHASELDQVLWRLASGLSRPGPFVAHISLPVAMQTTVAPMPLRLPIQGASAPACAPEDLRRFAGMLAAKPFAIWVGFGARHAGPAIRALAERTGAPVMCTPRAKGIFPEDHPQFLGVTGLGGYGGVEDALGVLQPAHTLVLGSRLAEASSYYQQALVPREAFIHVDLDPEVPGTAYQTANTYAVQADVGAFVEGLLAHLPPQPAPSRRVAAAAPRLTPELGARSERRVRPTFLMQQIQRVFVEGSDAAILADSGNSFAWAINALRFDEPGRFRVSSALGSMGHATAGVVGAALGRGGKALAIAGDGAMLMNNEISTAVQYRAKAVWVVLNDSRYGMVAQGMEAQGFTPVETDFPEADFVLIARGMGADGVRVDREEQVEAALRRALEAEGPFVVDVHIDRGIPGPWMKRIQHLILQGAKGGGPTARA